MEAAKENAVLFAELIGAPELYARAGDAAAMQVAAGEFPVTADSRLELGVGFHYGPVIHEQQDIFGDAVNLAARLVEQAAKGQVLFAAETGDALSAPYRRLM